MLLNCALDGGGVIATQRGRSNCGAYPRPRVEGVSLWRGYRHFKGGDLIVARTRVHVLGVFWCILCLLTASSGNIHCLPFRVSLKRRATVRRHC